MRHGNATRFENDVEEGHSDGVRPNQHLLSAAVILWSPLLPKLLPRARVAPSLAAPEIPQLPLIVEVSLVPEAGFEPASPCGGGILRGISGSLVSASLHWIYVCNTLKMVDLPVTPNSCRQTQQLIAELPILNRECTKYAPNLKKASQSSCVPIASSSARS